MLYAEKGNKVKEIDESMIQSCVEQGYRVVDEHGNLVQDTIPTDTATLKLAYKQHEEIIREQKATILALESEIAELKAKKSTPAEPGLGTAKTKRSSAKATE